MNKKILITISVFILIVGLIIFSFKSCNLRTKTVDTAAEEYSAFINANIEFTCMLAKNPALSENNEDNQQELNKIYKKYQLPVEDNQKMMNILKVYANDTEAAAIIQSNTQNCLQGGSPIFYQ